MVLVLFHEPDDTLFPNGEIYASVELVVTSILVMLPDEEVTVIALPLAKRNCCPETETVPSILTVIGVFVAEVLLALMSDFVNV